MSVNPATLHEFAGKNVNIVLTGEFADLSGEGKVEAASPAGMSFKPKGKGPVIVLPSDVESIEAATTKPKKILVKELLPVVLDNVRQHLVDRHGYRVPDIEVYEPQAALEFHNTLDHSALGHNHEKKAVDAS